MLPRDTERSPRGAASMLLRELLPNTSLPPPNTSPFIAPWTSPSLGRRTRRRGPGAISRARAASRRARLTSLSMTARRKRCASVVPPHGTGAALLLLDDRAPLPPAAVPRAASGCGKAVMVMEVRSGALAWGQATV